MFRTFAIPLTWTELFKRTYRESVSDNVLGLAAQLAFYFLLALAPAVVFIAALASLFPVDVLEQLTGKIATVAPGDVATILSDQLRNIAGRGNTGLLTFGLAMALWSSSSAIVSIVDSLNRAYDIEEGRPWWRVRLTAIGLTAALAVFVLVASGLVLVGPQLAEAVASRVGLGSAFEWTWKIAQWPLVFGIIALALAIVNYFGPDAEQDWTWVTPGAVVATALWLLASLAFRFYLTNFADYNATYGSLGGVIVLMLWFYVSGIAILVGAEMNAEIEHASPYGKDPGEKVIGQKKKIGTAAARAWEERQHQRPATAPVSTPRPAPAGARPHPARTSTSSAFTGGFVYLLTRLFKRRVSR
jgi:membrane protein